MALILEDATKPMSRGAVERAFADRIANLQDAHVHLPRNDVSYATEVGLRMLCERKMILREVGCYRANPDEKNALAFYSNSIRHHFC